VKFIALCSANKMVICVWQPSQTCNCL